MGFRDLAFRVRGLGFFLFVAPSLATELDYLNPKGTLKKDSICSLWFSGDNFIFFQGPGRSISHLNTYSIYYAMVLRLEDVLVEGGRAFAIMGRGLAPISPNPEPFKGMIGVHQTTQEGREKKRNVEFTASSREKGSEQTW